LNISWYEQTIVSQFDHELLQISFAAVTIAKHIILFSLEIDLRMVNLLLVAKLFTLEFGFHGRGEANDSSVKLKV
jgi:hypothetical protein